jgi:hypothetical protein
MLYFLNHEFGGSILTQVLFNLNQFISNRPHIYSMLQLQKGRTVNETYEETIL